MVEAVDEEGATEKRPSSQKSTPGHFPSTLLAETDLPKRAVSFVLADPDVDRRSVSDPLERPRSISPGERQDSIYLSLSLQIRTLAVIQRVAKSNLG